MSNHCHSCAMPLDSPEATGSSPIYCRHCSNEQGELKPREEVKQGLIWWLKSWQGDITEEQAQNRAENYMKAMPAWAED